MSEPKKGIVFAYYTFQMSAFQNTGMVQLLDNRLVDIQDIVSQKNQLLTTALTDKKYKFEYGKNFLNYKLLYNDGYYFVFKLANYKKIKAEKDFKEVFYDNEPSILVIIQNDPQNQLIAIQKDPTVFHSVDAVAETVQNTLRFILHEYKLKPDVNNVFDEKQFWDLIGSYSQQIESIRFEFVKENNEELYKNLSEDLADAAKKMNSHKTILQYTAPDNGVLEDVNPQNAQLENLVQSASRGIAPIKVKIRGKKHTVSTRNKTVTKEFGDIDIEGQDYEKIGYIIQQFFKDV